MFKYRAVESNGNANVRNKRSSAIGAGQFLNETWLELIRAYRADLSQARNENEILDLRRDPEEQSTSRQKMRPCQQGEGEQHCIDQEASLIRRHDYFPLFGCVVYRDVWRLAVPCQIRQQSHLNANLSFKQCTLTRNVDLSLERLWRGDHSIGDRFNVMKIL
jgi:hypothetical protein